MDSRERVELALAHAEPDRVPIDYWAADAISARLREHFAVATQEELLQELDVDFRYVEGPRYIGPELTVRADGQVEDHFGVPRVPVNFGMGDKGGTYQEVVDFPLAQARSLDEIKNYSKWPDPDWFDYQCVAEQVAHARQSGKIVVFMGDRMNRAAQLKPAMYLRGIDQIFVDMVEQPEIAEFIFGRIAEFYLEYCRRTFEAAGAGLDIFFSGDDFGTQRGLFVSPKMWRRMLMPGFRSIVQLGKKHGYQVAHHTCGSVWPILEDMIDCGLDILNPVQPDVLGMDRPDLKNAYGDRLTFHGSISIQKTMPHGTPDDVRAEVRERFETLGPGGGFFFCTAHNIQVDTPLENVLALFEAYREFGRYR
jgi:uroporphyrinogen decarboxylase